MHAFSFSIPLVLSDSRAGEFRQATPFLPLPHLFFAKTSPRQFLGTAKLF